MQVITLIQHTDLHVGIQLDEAPRFAVLLRNEPLVERRDFDVEVVGRQVEVGTERLRRVAVAITFEGERTRFVLPRDRIEVEQLRELSLRVVREAHLLVRKLLHAPIGSYCPTAGNDNCTASWISCTTGARLNENTPWPSRIKSSHSSSVSAITTLDPPSMTMRTDARSLPNLRNDSTALRADCNARPASSICLMTRNSTRSRHA